MFGTSCSANLTWGGWHNCMHTHGCFTSICSIIFSFLYITRLLLLSSHSRQSRRAASLLIRRRTQRSSSVPRPATDPESASELPISGAMFCPGRRKSASLRRDCRAALGSSVCTPELLFIFEASGVQLWKSTNSGSEWANRALLSRNDNSLILKKDTEEKWRT